MISMIIKACLDEGYSGNGIFEHVRENGGERYVKEQIAHALNEASAVRPGQKAIIRHKSGGRHDATDATQAALIATGCPVYVRGGALVEPIWRWEKTSEKNRDMLVTMFVRLNESRAQLHDR